VPHARIRSALPDRGQVHLDARRGAAPVARRPVLLEAELKESVVVTKLRFENNDRERECDRMESP